MGAIRLPLCAQVQDTLFGSLSPRFSGASEVTSPVRSQSARPWTRSVGVERRTRKTHLRCDDAGVGDSTRSHVGTRFTVTNKVPPTRSGLTLVTAAIGTLRRVARIEGQHPAGNLTCQNVSRIAVARLRFDEPGR